MILFICLGIYSNPKISYVSLAVCFVSFFVYDVYPQWYVNQYVCWKQIFFTLIIIGTYSLIWLVSQVWLLKYLHVSVSVWFLDISTYQWSSDKWRQRVINLIGCCGVPRDLALPKRKADIFCFAYHTSNTAWLKKNTVTQLKNYPLNNGYPWKLRYLGHT